MKHIKLFFLLALIVWMLPNNADAQQQLGNGRPFFRNYTALEYNGHNRNFDIECDDKGHIFVANFEGLLVNDGTSWHTYHTPGISRLTALFKDKTGTIWFGGSNILGYVEITDSVTMKYVVDDKSDDNRIGEVSKIFTHHNTICFITSDGQCYSVSNGKLKVCESISSDKQNFYYNGIEVTDKVELKGHDMTILATTTNGAVAINNNGDLLGMLTTNDKLCSNNINALAYDGKGTVWGATDNGIFAIYVSWVFAHYSETDGLLGQVTSIISNGNKFLVGTLQGLYVLNDNNHFYRVQEIDLACWQLAKSPDGTVLAATANGVFSYTDIVRQIIPNHTLSIYTDCTQGFLAGTTDGIYRSDYNGNLTLLDRIPNVVKFRKDHDGGLWAVNLNNDTYYCPTGSIHFAKRKSNNLSVLFDYTDSDGRLWRSKNDGDGLVCASLSDSQKKWFEPFSEYSIQAMEIYDDVAWIGGNFGLIRINLANMVSNNMYLPKIYLRSVTSGSSDLHFTVTSDKNDPIGHTRYSYRLNDDEPWSTWTQDPVFDFNNLAPKNYHISVRLQDAYGNMAISEPMEFSVPIPFFMRWYMVLLYLIIFILIVYMYFRWRTYRTQQENERLERVVEERTQDLKEAQSQLIRQEREATVGKLTKGLIDRILNPMNYINNFSHLSIGLAKDLTEDLEDDQEKMTPDIYEDSMDVISMMKTNLEKIEQHGLSTTRILKAMEELLKERTGKVEPTNLNNLCQQALEIFRKYNEQEIADCRVTIEEILPDDPSVADTCPQNMSRAILSILNNSMYAVHKRAEKEPDGYKPVIRLSLIPKNTIQPPHIVIYDNGIGIEEGIIDKIFDPFFTTKPTAEASGVGLYLTQQVIQDIGGTISVTSQKDDHTEVNISLP